MKDYIAATYDFFAPFLVPVLIVGCIIVGVVYFTRKLNPKRQYLIQTPLISGAFIWLAWDLSAFYILWFCLPYMIIDGFKVYHSKQKQ